MPVHRQSHVHESADQWWESGNWSPELQHALDRAYLWQSAAILAGCCLSCSWSAPFDCTERLPSQYHDSAQTNLHEKVDMIQTLSVWCANGDLQLYWMTQTIIMYYSNEVKSDIAPINWMLPTFFMTLQSLDSSCSVAAATNCIEAV
jgi:hypothetical protein